MIGFSVCMTNDFGSEGGIILMPNFEFRPSLSSEPHAISEKLINVKFRGNKEGK